MAKWPNHFISGKQFQKRPNIADFAFKKAKWQPCPEWTLNQSYLHHILNMITIFYQFLVVNDLNMEAILFTYCIMKLG